MLGGFKKALQLSLPERRIVGQNAVEFVRKNFEINEKDWFGIEMF